MLTLSPFMINLILLGAFAGAALTSLFMAHEKLFKKEKTLTGGQAAFARSLILIGAACCLAAIDIAIFLITGESFMPHNTGETRYVYLRFLAERLLPLMA